MNGDPDQGFSTRALSAVTEEFVEDSSRSRIVACNIIHYVA
jgi:hypothetical protein